MAAVVDLFSRGVVGWSMNAAMTAQLVTGALVMAIRRRGKPDAPLHHSDRGSQHASEQFQRLMADYGVVCSMSRSRQINENFVFLNFPDEYVRKIEALVYPEWFRGVRSTTPAT
jgi:putative transposase